MFSVQYVWAQPSVLSSGNWFKITIPQTGVYKLDFNQLRQAGIDVNSIDPRTLKLYGNAGGMLPQANTTARPNDLVENAIIVQGESDGVFNASDFILFYAQGPNAQRSNPAKEIIYYEQNLYATKNYFFLTYGETVGKRIQVAPFVNGTVTISQFQDVVHYERTLTNILQSGREWYGERFENGAGQTIKVELEGIVPGTQMKLISDVVAYSLAGSSFKVSINNIPAGEQGVQLVPNSQYGIKARHKRDTFSIAADNIGATTRISQDITYAFSKVGSSSAYGHLDFFTVTGTRKLAVYGAQTSFRSFESLQQNTTNFSIDKATSATQVWDVSDPYTPALQTVQLSGNVATISAGTEILKEFIAFNQTLSVEAIKKIPNQNLHGTSSIALLIVTDSELQAEAQRLADHRTSFSGITSRVVTTEEIFNEFSSGRPDVTAIRDFARLLKKRYPTDFKHLLLFGKGTYDYKNTLTDNVNRVFTYESRNSVSPLETYSSDDFFGLLEDHEGEWNECFSCDETLDIGVGRIPVKKKEQATFIVDKIIDYDTNQEKRGNWQTTLAFVADDGDFNIHQTQADLLASSIESAEASVFNTNKIYVDSYQQTSRPGGQIAPDVNTAIKNVFEQGSLIINYTGHGNEFQWADEKILDQLMILNITNERLPFLVTATCAFGRHDDPILTSVAELALLREEYGVIGLVTTARDVNSSTNFDLNRAFYEAFLTRQNGQFQTLGEIFQQTKNNSSSGVANRNFSLLGDPSMKLAFPQERIEIESVTTNQETDTLRALSLVTIKGFVTNQNEEIDSDFNGRLEVSVFDKAASFRTLGNQSPSFTYKQWANLLFKGQSRVEAGSFEFSFIVPKNIAYAVGDGSINLFAISADKTAAGSGSLKVGGSAVNPSIDTTPPQVRVFMNDSTFTNGGIVSSEAKLVVRLSDESGITISGFGIGNDLIAVLDDNISFDLNNYYTADVNDYTKGTVVYPLSGLTPGKHRIKVMSWDTHNNPAEGEVDFVVSNGEAMVIESFGNYPNPFSGESTLFFTHNTAGEDVFAEIVIYGSRGESIMKENVSIENSAFRVDLGTITKGDLPAGIYVAHLFLRSETSGKLARAQAKLIIVN